MINQKTRCSRLGFESFCCKILRYLSNLFNKSHRHYLRFLYCKILASFNTVWCHPWNKPITKVLSQEQNFYHRQSSFSKIWDRRDSFAPYSIHNKIIWYNFEKKKRKKVNILWYTFNVNASNKAIQTKTMNYLSVSAWSGYVICKD